MDEKWKPSKKDLMSSSCGTSSTSHSSSKFGFTRSSSTRSSSSKSPLLRSFSQKCSTTASSSSNHHNSKSSLPRSFSQKNSSIGRKCSSLAKEQKARFYIMRRCVAMLVCWHKHGDSWDLNLFSFFFFFPFLVLLLGFLFLVCYVLGTVCCFCLRDVCLGFVWNSEIFPPSDQEDNVEKERKKLFRDFCSLFFFGIGMVIIMSSL